MEQSMRRVLVVDDEADIRTLLLYNLEKAGFEAQAVKDGVAALRAAKKFRPHLILLDVMMPKMSGWEVCRRLREDRMTSHMRIVFLTARGEEDSEVQGFDLGADEYIVKPIKPKALVRRLLRLLAQSPTAPEVLPIIDVKDLYMDPGRFEARYKTRVLRLRKREFELLYLLARHSGRVFSREELMRALWGEEVYVSPRTIDVHIRRIRKHIGDACLRTLSGRGYIYE